VRAAPKIVVCEADGQANDAGRPSRSAPRLQSPSSRRRCRPLLPPPPRYAHVTMAVHHVTMVFDHATMVRFHITMVFGHKTVL